MSGKIIEYKPFYYIISNVILRVNEYVILILTLFYGLFKTMFGLENYLLKLSSIERGYISKLRCCNVKSPVELGRWCNILKDERTCY